mgnify:CR=1 FL=1
MDAEVLRTRLRQDGHTTLRMRGNSMFPLLPSGSKAHLRPVAAGESLRGAIVAVELGKQVVVHRVMKSTSGALVTQGIASPTQDAPIPSEAVVGVVCEGVGWNLSEPALRHSASALMIAMRGLRALSRRR